MKIAINLLPFSIGGGKTYIDNFLKELGSFQKSHDFFLICRKNIDNSQLSKCGYKIIEVSVPGKSGYLRILYEQFIIPFILFRKNIDVFYNPTDNVSLLSKCPSVMAMRNLNLYVQSKPHKTILEKFRYYLLRKLACLSAKKAKAVIFVSHTSMNITTEQIPALKDKSSVIYHGVCKKLTDKKFILDGNCPYILIVATIYPHKNILTVLKAFNKLIKAEKINHKLLIAGKIEDKNYYASLNSFIVANKLEDKVIFQGQVEYSSIGSYYCGAELLVFPSFFETFGHPLVEAMICGLPVAASDIEVTKEILKDCAVFFDNKDEADMAEKIYSLLSNENLRSQLIKKGYNRVQDFSWKKTAEETLKLIEKVKI